MSTNGWASGHIAKLKQGEPVTFRPRGTSMEPRVKDGQEVTVEPLGDDIPARGDVVLCSVNGRHYLHLVRRVANKGGNTRVLIANNRGHINGWIGLSQIFGRMRR